MKEYLTRSIDGEYTLTNHKLTENDIEIPDGAEIAIKFKNDSSGYGVIFYKNNGESVFSEKRKNWENGSNWTMSELLDENHFYDEVDLSHHILWQHHTQPEELPFVDSINDQYAEIEQVRQSAIKVDSDHMADAMSYGYMGISAPKKHRHYFKDVSNIAEIDVYAVLKLFDVTDPCLQHIVKKALCAGKRGHKDMMEDLQNIVDTAIRAVELNS